MSFFECSRLRELGENNPRSRFIVGAVGFFGSFFGGGFLLRTLLNHENPIIPAVATVVSFVMFALAYLSLLDGVTSLRNGVTSPQSGYQQV